MTTENPFTWLVARVSAVRERGGETAGWLFRRLSALGAAGGTMDDGPVESSGDTRGDC